MNNSHIETAGAQIQELLQKLQAANHSVELNPLQACQGFTDVIQACRQQMKETDGEVFNVYCRIQETARENLIQASLIAVEPHDLEDVTPLLQGQMHRLNNLLNVGFYLYEHKTQIVVDGDTFTAGNCAEKAQQLSPENAMVQRLSALTSQIEFA